MRALSRHIYLEEEVLFPRLRRAGYAEQVRPMWREHGQLWRLLDRLEDGLAHGARRPSLSGLCQQLAGRLLRHTDAEEVGLYRHAAGPLDATATPALHALLVGAEPPRGWSCRDADTPGSRALQLRTPPDGPSGPGPSAVVTDTSP